MTPNELTRRFPNASRAFIAANCDPQGLCTTEPKQDSRNALEQALPRKEAGWPFPGKRFVITFRVYSTRPCDWDNYFTKPLQDCLVAAGFLPGDDWQTLSGKVETRKVQHRKEERTVVIIERIA